MAATSKKITVYHTQMIDGTPGKLNSEIFKTVLPTDINSDTAQAVINWAQNFVAITNDEYEHTKIEEEVSLNEILVDD